MTLLHETMRQLEESYGDRPQIFAVLKVFLLPTGHAMSYEEAASELKGSVPAVKTLIHRLPQQYILLLRQKAVRTVSNEAALVDEIHYLSVGLVKTNTPSSIPH